MTMNTLMMFYVAAVLVPLIVLILSIFLRRAPMFLYFFYMPFILLSIFIFSLGYLFEITASSLETAMLATRVQYIGIPFIGPLLLLFILEFCGFRLKKRLITSILIVPLISLVLMQSYPVHHLFYQQVSLISDDGLLSHLTVTGGVFYYIFYAYQYIMALVSLDRKSVV